MAISESIPRRVYDRRSASQLSVPSLDPSDEEEENRKQGGGLEKGGMEADEMEETRNRVARDKAAEQARRQQEDAIRALNVQVYTLEERQAHDDLMEVIDSTLDLLNIGKVMEDMSDTYCTYHLRFQESGRVNRGTYQMYQFEVMDKHQEPLTITLESSILSRQSLYVSTIHQCPSGGNCEWRSEEKGMNTISLSGDNFHSGIYNVGFTGVVSGKYRIKVQSGPLLWVEEHYSNGGFYEGLKSGPVKHGLGTYTAASGSRHKGEYVRDKRHGEGRASMANGEKFVGVWRFGEWFEGQGTVICLHDLTFSGSWKLLEMGTKMARVEGVYSNGDYFCGDFKGIERHGDGYCKYASGISYRGGWKEDKFHGPGVITYEGGRELRGHWTDGIVNSTGLSMDDMEKEVVEGGGIRSCVEASTLIGKNKKAPKSMSRELWPLSRTPSPSVSVPAEKQRTWSSMIRAFPEKQSPKSLIESPTKGLTVHVSSPPPHSLSLTRASSPYKKYSAILAHKRDQNIMSGVSIGQGPIALSRSQVSLGSLGFGGLSVLNDSHLDLQTNSMQQVSVKDKNFRFPSRGIDTGDGSFMVMNTDLAPSMPSRPASTAPILSLSPLPNKNPAPKLRL